VILVVPFPRQRLLLLQPSRPPIDILPPAHTPTRDRQTHVTTALVADFSGSDASSCRQFIQHHAPMFDVAVIVDSTASSVLKTIFQAVAPSSWRLISSSSFTLASLFPTISKEDSVWSINLQEFQLLVRHRIHGAQYQTTGTESPLCC
jgi:hypothetical protein